MITHFISSNSIYTHDGNDYCKNGIKLINEDGSPMTDSAFNLLIKKETSSFIHKSFTNIVILAGAGASVLCTSGKIDARFGKTVFMLAELINDALKQDPNLFTLQELANLCKYNTPVENKGKSATSKLNPSFNLEDFLSDLLSFEKYVSNTDQTKYIQSKDKIFKLIVSNTSYDYDNICLKHAAFINTVSHLVRTPSKLTIVTTNYDTLIEDAADSIGYTVMDGFSFSHRPYFDSDMFEWNLVKDIENIKTREHEYKKNIINLLKLHGSLTWERDANGIRRKEKTDVVNPIMIFPSSNKYMQSYQDPYFELFTKFQELLKRPNTLLITTGFSFADNHISQMIIQAILHNKSLATLISDYNITQSNPNWDKLTELMKQNYQIAFLQASMNSDLTEYLGEYYDN
ncbi:MAG: SIR2 family protein [Lachnospiraceae bacterium]|nr:SIR2 family protein [Lachnospiraceae bacterium]